MNDPTLRDMKVAAATFLHEIAAGAPPRWLCLFGTSGAGKTFLAELILAAIKRHRMLDNETFLSGITHDGALKMKFEIALAGMLNRKEWGRFEDFCNAKSALIDDIATGLVPADISTPKLLSLAERRLGKWTVWTCNLSLQQIKERLDTRIASRMIRGGSVVVDVNVSDFNLRKA